MHKEVAKGKPDYLSMLYPNVKYERTHYMMVVIRGDKPMTDNALLGN